MEKDSPWLLCASCLPRRVRGGMGSPRPPAGHHHGCPDERSRHRSGRRGEGHLQRCRHRRGRPLLPGSSQPPRHARGDLPRLCRPGNPRHFRRADPRRPGTGRRPDGRSHRDRLRHLQEIGLRRFGVQRETGETGRRPGRVLPGHAAGQRPRRPVQPGLRPAGFRHLAEHPRHGLLQRQQLPALCGGRHSDPQR